MFRADFGREDFSFLMLPCFNIKKFFTLTLLGVYPFKPAILLDFQGRELMLLLGSLDYEPSSDSIVNPGFSLYKVLFAYGCSKMEELVFSFATDLNDVDVCMKPDEELRCVMVLPFVLDTILLSWLRDCLLRF